MITYPLFNCAGLAQGSFCSGDTVGDTAVTFAKAPELSTHFLGKKAKASWSEYINSQRGFFFTQDQHTVVDWFPHQTFYETAWNYFVSALKQDVWAGHIEKVRPLFNSQLAVLATCWSVTYLIEHFQFFFFAVYNLPTGEVWWYLLVTCSTLFNLKYNSSKSYSLKNAGLFFKPNCWVEMSVSCVSSGRFAWWKRHERLA